jgi:hypothetical protein
MPMVRRGDEDGVDVLAIEHFAKVAIHAGRGPPFFREQFERLVPLPIIHVAHRRKFHPGHLEQPAHVAAPHAPGPDHAHDHALIGSLRPAHRPCTQAEAKRSRGSAGKKIAAGDFGFHRQYFD